MGKLMNIMIYSNIFILIMFLIIAGIQACLGPGRKIDATCQNSGGICGPGTQCVDENAFNPDAPLPSEVYDKLELNCSQGQICCPIGTIAKQN
jgi:hypothetical protein